MNRRKAIIAILLLGAAGAGAWMLYGRYSHANDNVIRVSGNLELTQVDISFKISGKLIERTVDEGDSLKKGDLVARIDPDLTERQTQRDSAGVDAAQSQIAQMAASIDLQRATTDADLDLRRAELRQAQARLDELLAGSRKQEILQARAQVTEAQSAYDQAKRDWDRAQPLYKNEDISTQQYDMFRMRYESTQAVLRQSQERLGLVEEGPRKEEIESARAAVARAQAAVKLSEASRFELKRREIELETRKAEVARASAQMAMSQSQLNDTRVVAPIDGVVLVKSAEIGEVLAAGATVLTLGDVDHPWLRAYIREQDLGRVKLGQKAKLTTDSYPNKVYWGRISFIASEAEFTPKQIQTSEERIKLVYRVKIEVDNPQHELKSNMPVDAEIQL